MKNNVQTKKLINATKKKLVVMTLSLIIMIAAIFSFQIILVPTFVFSRMVVQAIVAIIVIILIIFKIIQYIRILTKKEFAKKMVIIKNDERNIYINNKVYSLEFKFALYCLSIALVITGFFELPYVYFTILIILLSLIIVRLLLRIYFRGKY